MVQYAIIELGDLERSWSFMKVKLFLFIFFLSDLVIYPQVHI